MEPSLSLTLLGGFAVRRDGRLVQGFESVKARALLAYLAVERELPHRRERLAGMLWPDLPERRARHNLSQALHNLRTVLGDAGTAGTSPDSPSLFHIKPGAIQISDQLDLHVDVVAFQAGRLGCPAHQPEPVDVCPSCLFALSEAVKLYRGEFLAGYSCDGCLEMESWILITRERLHREALSALDAAARCHRRLGRPGEAMGFARRAVALDPYWEGARRELMQALWLTGRRSEALAQYEACRQLLEEELGVAPDEQTQRLARRIRADTEIVAPQPSGRHNLPHALTPFVGREAELAQIKRLLYSDCRLLTLLGPGGSGKTRLAVEAARRLIDHFPDGLYLVSLAEVPDAGGLVPALLEALAVQPQQGRDPDGQLADYLRHKRLLLLMDSFETILDGANLVVSVLRAAPGLKVLATSRARLNVKGEQLFPVEGLSLGEDEREDGAGPSDAVNLFKSVARRVRPDYEPDSTEMAAISNVCRQVQGLPLGIILAGAWLEVLSPVEIAARIGSSLDFLTVDWPDLPPRQRSLRATMDYSWALLDADLQTTFRALSVFQGGFDANAAEAVAGASPTTLRALAHRTLLQQTEEDRFRIHDLLRQYAAERLASKPAEAARVAEAHAAYFTARLAAMSRDLKSARQQAALIAGDADAPNLAQAWVWAVEHRRLAWLDEGLEGLCLYYELRGRHNEAEATCQHLVTMLNDVAPTSLAAVRAQLWLARLSRQLGNSDAAGALRRATAPTLAALEVDDKTVDGTAAFLNLEEGESLFSTDLAAALQAQERSIQRFAGVGEHWWANKARTALGLSLNHAGRYEESTRVLTEAAENWRQLGDLKGVAHCQSWIAFALLRRGRIAEAMPIMKESSELAMSAGDVAGGAASLRQLGLALMWGGQLEEAKEPLQRSLELYRDWGYQYQVTFLTAALGILATMRGDYSRSEELLTFSLAQAREHGYRREEAGSLLMRGLKKAAKRAFGEAKADLAESLRCYEKVQFRDELAWAQVGMAHALIGLGEESAAIEYLRQGLGFAVDSHSYAPLVFGLPAVALILVSRGEPLRAVETCACARKLPLAAANVLLDDLAFNLIGNLAAELDAEAVAGARARGSAMDPWELAAALLDEIAGG